MSQHQIIEQLRSMMKAANVQAYLIPRSNRFQGEEVEANKNRLEFITGFSGSAGLAIILQSQAALCTDGRYITQAQGEIDTDIFDIVDVTKINPFTWLSDQLQDKAVIGYHPWLYTYDQLQKAKEKITNTTLQWQAIDGNWVDDVWSDKPEVEHKPGFHHKEEYTDLSAQDKIQFLCDEMKQKKCDGYFIADPQMVCWLLNIRGQDLNYTPILQSYAYISVSGQCHLFCDQPNLKAPSSFQSEFDIDMSVHDLATLPHFLKKKADDVVWCPPEQTPQAVFDLLGEENCHKEPCILLEPRACKSKKCIQGMKQAQEIDAIAVQSVLNWLKGQKDLETITEYDVVERIKTVRATSQDYWSESFHPIVGCAENSAIIHYRPDPNKSSPLKNNVPILIDSGGQYHCGTTDITRTVVVGEASDDVKKIYTCVLRGLIQLSMTCFDAQTTGRELDQIARQTLKEIGLDYPHGTGHGVGSFLSVHEGPQSISPKSEQTLKPGMVLSNEPGFYDPERFGIRLENLILVVEDMQEANGEQMYRFETLTYVPFENDLIDLALLTGAEKEWLDEYHQECQRRSPE